MRILLVVTALLLWAPPTADAQYTGGSMGGGSWGGGSSWSGGSSWGGGSSWSSSSWGSSGGYSSSYGGGGSGCQSKGGQAAWMFVVFLILAVGLVGFVNDFIKVSGGAPPRQREPKVDVSVLRLAIDWHERAHVQKELERIAREVDLASPAGLLEMLRQVAHVLRRCKDSWLYAGVVDTKPLKRIEAEAFFTAQTQDARSRYQAELVRAGDGGVTTHETPDHLVAGFDEGEGLVVITIVMAARGELNDFGVMNSVEDVRAWFEGLDYVTSSALVACEVVWSPAAEDDRLSSAELVVLYPEMKKIKHGVLSGRAECEYCKGHFPAELVTCPHCGGKVSDEYKAA